MRVGWILLGSGLALSTIALAAEPEAAGTLTERFQNLSAKFQSLAGRSRFAAPDSASLVGIQRDLELLLNEVKAIYGPDDRRNYYRASPHERRAADATAVLVNSLKVTPNDDGTVSVSDEGAHLCGPASGFPAERFWDEPAPGFCSGFKVGPRLIATAGHCVHVATCPSTTVLFGFRKETESQPVSTTFARKDLYQCREVVAGALGGEDGSDWRVIRVDRDIEDVPTVALSSDPVQFGQPLTVVGYPMGLPVKIAANATVRDVRQAFFVANLDTYGGNSGSVVYDTDKLRAGELVARGVLVRGEEDFLMSSPCRISNKCPDQGCRGEDVTKAEMLRAAIP
ncbi:hypothetical protein AUC68_11640 [Methyloceanibacter methanicus]|uniref:Serine protease n=1 Tax=Methyloceanibacter methanicus TaxID=1774968 RepID=A0A1E3W5E3_9HYPH|nr:serine protease [Methyloceanibacter methanicus]ODS01038.1 hypothetical protein AUC68_11640 [Methyloceanibacter methanicus]